jgi:hypothetical protein
MSDQQQPDMKVTRVIDFRIPLPWLIGILSGIAWAVISMYFSLNQLVRDVADLQITVKAGNSQATTVAGDIALLRFRIENLEAEKRLGMSIPPAAKR